MLDDLKLVSKSITTNVLLSILSDNSREGIPDGPVH